MTSSCLISYRFHSFPTLHQAPDLITPPPPVVLSLSGVDIWNQACISVWAEVKHSIICIAFAGELFTYGGVDRILHPPSISWCYDLDECPPRIHVLKAGFCDGSTERWWNFQDLSSSGRFLDHRSYTLKGSVGLQSFPLSLFRLLTSAFCFVALCLEMVPWSEAQGNEVTPGLYNDNPKEMFLSLS